MQKARGLPHAKGEAWGDLRHQAAAAVADAAGGCVQAGRCRRPTSSSTSRRACGSSTTGPFPAQLSAPTVRSHPACLSRAVRCCRHVNGNHYGLTSEAWLQNLDQHREAALPILADIYKKCEDGGAAPSHLPQPPCLRCFGHPPSRRRGTNRLTRGGGLSQERRRRSVCGGSAGGGRSSWHAPSASLGRAATSGSSRTIFSRTTSSSFEEGLK